MLKTIIFGYWNYELFILPLYFSWLFYHKPVLFFIKKKKDTLKHWGLERSSSLIKNCEKKLKGHLVFTCSQLLCLDAEAKLWGR